MTYEDDALCSKRTTEISSLLQVLILVHQTTCGTKIAYRLPPPFFGNVFLKKVRKRAPYSRSITLNHNPGLPILTRQGLLG